MADDSTTATTAEGRSRGIRASGRRRRQRSTNSRVLKIVAWTSAGVVVLGGTGLGYAYFQLNGNLKGVDINSALGTERPQNVDDGSQDILVLGSDSRAGKNGKYGADEGSARSDTAMIMHIYEGHKKASVVSIPRDTLVHRPQCTDPKGGDSPAASQVMFNESYSVGGPACAVKTVESMTKIRMDHYIEVDFTGFKKLIDTLGGVDITTTQKIQDEKSHLDLDAGKHTLKGEQALGLVRTRHGVGDGSDLGRIQVQQAFIKALMDQVKDVGLFGDPAKLFKVADTATKAVTTDSELNSVKDLTSFASGIKGIGSNDISMTTLPVTYDPADLNRVLPLDKKAGQVWRALKADQPIPKSATKGSAGGKAGAGGTVK
ncbi:LCP family protein [Streptomyces sp. H27-D2]|uniref:LCP family protein n=1 Tax=Streptomyces sp. H27-D2 TaxID=3046304 RepID=UPI002DBB6507|nr:LCP family protein [Streptomyces sp. H27-D2]MEC4016737.1 LCP family protein [Streptomyces sp. H27-D2]